MVIGIVGKVSNMGWHMMGSASFPLELCWKLLRVEAVLLEAVDVSITVFEFLTDLVVFVLQWISPLCWKDVLFQVFNVVAEDPNSILGFALVV